MSYLDKAVGIHDLEVGKSYIPLTSDGALDYKQAGTYGKKSANPNTATLRWLNEPFVFKMPAFFIKARPDSEGHLKPVTAGGRRSRKALRKRRRSTTRR